MMNGDKEKIIIEEEEEDINLAKIPKTEFYTKNGHKSRFLQGLAVGLVLLGAIGFVVTGSLIGWKIVNPVMMHNIEPVNLEPRNPDEISRSIENTSGKTILFEVFF